MDPLTNEDVADILALLDSLPYDEFDLETPRFRLTLRRTPGGWTRSTSSKTTRIVSPSSSSEGWNRVYVISGDWLSSKGTSSWICSPSSDQPCDAAPAASSSVVSERVTYSPGSPRRTPSSKN